MAVIVTNEDGTYASECALCGNPLTEPIFATSHFIADKSHELYRFSDAAMHWDCYAGWPEQARFAAMYFEARLSAAESDPWPKYWPVLWKSSGALVQYGLAVNEISVILKKSGTDIRVARNEWPRWLNGEWRCGCRPGLEANAVRELIPDLQKLSLPAK